MKNNLWALCEECNTGKKNWFADVHSGVATEVMRQKSGSARLRKLFELSPNKPLEVSTLQAIAGTRDWTRTVRAIRSNKSMNISYTKSIDGTEYYTHNID